MLKGGCLQHLVLPFITLHDFGSVSTVSLDFYSSANYFQPCIFSPGLTHHSDSNPHHCCGLLFRKWAHDDTLGKNKEPNLIWETLHSLPI